MKAIILALALFISGCTTSADVGREVKEPLPTPFRAEQAEEGLVITGQLDGASLIDFTALTEEERKYISCGNAWILADLIKIYYGFYKIQPTNWEEFRATPLMRNIILYNPYTGKPLKLSETFSPGDIKIFGCDENGRSGVAFYDNIDTGKPGAAHSTEFTPWDGTYFDIFFKPGGPVRMPASDIEWDWYFVGFFANRMFGEHGDEPENLTNSAARLCYRVIPYNTFLFSILEPGGNGKILNLDNVEGPLSLTIKVYPGHQAVVFNVRGSDESPLLKLAAFEGDPYTAVPPPMD